MSSSTVLIIQPVWSHKMAVRAPNLPGLLIHHFRKLFHRSSHVFCNGIGTVIIRFKHQPVKQIPHIKLLSLFCPQMNLGLGCRFCTECHHFIHTAVFHGKNTGQYLCCTGIRQLLSLILSIQKAIAVAICHGACFRIKTAFLRFFDFLCFNSIYHIYSNQAAAKKYCHFF